MSELPSGWVETTVAQLLADYQAGFASGKKDAIGGLKHLRMNNITVNGSLDLSLTRTVPNDLAGKRHILQEGDVVICTTNSAKLVGKVAYFDLKGEYAFSNHLTCLRTDPEGCVSRYLYYYLLHYWKQNGYEGKSKHWVNQSSLPKEELLALPVALAPLNEQKRIVAKLDELLPKVEACKQRLEKMPTILKRFRQSVLAECFSACFEPDSGWTQYKLGDLFDMANGKSLTQNKREDGSVPVFGGNGLMGTHSKSNHSGDKIVVGRVGAQCGNVHAHSGDAWITDNAICLKPKVESDLLFFKYALEFRRLNELSGGTGQPYVSQDILNPLDIWIPSVTRQEQIVAQFSGRTSLLSKLEERLNRSSIVAGRLGDALLHQAFSGCLVPQDPSDEPAAMLLNRIKSSATPRAKKPSSRKRKSEKEPQSLSA